MRKLNIKGSLKRATSKSELKADFMTIIAALPWILIPTLLGMSGWPALGVAFGTTWLLGALTGNTGMCRAAWALAIVHILYATSSDSIAKIVGKPVWRFDTTGGLVQSINLPASSPGVQGLASAMQAGAQLTRLHDGTVAPSYPGMADWQQDYQQQALNGWGTDYNGQAALASQPRFAGSPFGN